MIGEKLLHYEITEKLGEGGMGVVYKARDTHLDRWVALKVLPPEKVADPNRKARFIQEAKAASALHHANIVTIHDIAADRGIDFIAMEYVAGQTLDRLIPRKGLRLNETLKLALQIAGALARAHAAGIVHRDLKPANVMVDDHGGVKLLDFGLAKLVEPATSSDATTATMAAKTEEGKVVGTVAYMSPEQAQGHALDARTDLFSFGAVLYEMLAGLRAFQGTSSMSVLSAVLTAEPAPLAAEVPYELRRLIERCLRKDPERRFQHMDDVKVALEDLKQESDSGKLSLGGEARSPARRRRTYVWVALAAAVVLVMLGGLWRFARQEHSPQALREIPFVTEPGNEQYPVFSPDGTIVAFSSIPEGVRRGAEASEDTIQLKMIGTDAIQVLRKNAWSPAWSPDSQWLAFEANAEGNLEIYVVRASGGKHRRLTSDPANDNNPRWSADGKWIYFLSDRGGQRRGWKVTSEGGEAIAADQETLGSYGPGSDHLYYVVKGSLWRKPSSGGAEEKILSGMNGTSFAVSAKGVYFTIRMRDSQQAPWKYEIAFHDFATGQRTKIADLRPGTFSGTGYSVSPDDRDLLYTQADREGSDLMLVENFR